MDYKEKTSFFMDLMEKYHLTDIIGMDISKISVEADAFVIGTASNEVLAKAAVEHITEDAEKEGLFVMGKEGVNKAKWILLDYTDVVLHIFSPSEREFYNLERLWQDSKSLGGKSNENSN